VVRRCDDGQQRDHRVQHDQQAPARATDRDEARGHQCRPREVQRRHRSQLVGGRCGDVTAVDAGAVDVQRVDEPVLGQHAGRSQREGDVDRQSGQRDRQEPRPDARPHVRMAGVDPHHETDACREVDEDVVVVQEVDGQAAAQDEVLQRALTEHAEPLLDADDPVGVRHRPVDIAAGQMTHLAVDHEDAHHQGELTDGRCDRASRPLTCGEGGC
jgi:hypothetical protein